MKQYAYNYQPRSKVRAKQDRYKRMVLAQRVPRLRQSAGDRTVRITFIGTNFRLTYTKNRPAATTHFSQLQSALSLDGCENLTQTRYKADVCSISKPSRDVCSNQMWLNGKGSGTQGGGSRIYSKGDKNKITLWRRSFF
jgi:hypothetical protein